MLRGDSAISATFEELKMFLFFQTVPRGAVSVLLEICELVFWSLENYKVAVAWHHPDREIILHEFELSLK